MFRKFLIPFICIAALSGCAQIELASHVGKKLAGTTDNAKSKGRYKVGSAYTIKGKRYYPKVDYDYNKKGVASWYGPGFHGKTTANGERYDQNALTAAHKTLPMPSIVRVTNLENGRSLIVRVNDRGPYAHGRIIDMSKRGAELLGFKNNGVAKVRVQVLEAESRKVAEIAQNGGSTTGKEIAMNKSSYKPLKTTQAQPLKPVQPAKVQMTSLKGANGNALPGTIKDGVFHPDPMISELPVQSSRVFVQAGSFTSREAAMKFGSGLDSFGRAQIQTATVDGAQYFRVRLPAQNVSAADTLLSNIIEAGHGDAIIVVD